MLHRASHVRDVADRLEAMADRVELSLLAVILTDQPYSLGSGIDMNGFILFRMLMRDWPGLARDVEGDPQLKDRLSQVLGIANEEWDELRAQPELKPRCYDDAFDFTERVQEFMKGMRCSE
jgi:hypothetical protein